MNKSDVEALYQEVKRRKKMVSGNNKALVEPRPQRKCNCGGKAKKIKSE